MRAIACLLLLVASPARAEPQDASPQDQGAQGASRRQPDDGADRQRESWQDQGAGSQQRGATRPSVFTDVHVLVMRYLDTGRVGVSVGASTGRRETADAQLRAYATHRWSVGARYRRTFAGDAHAGEAYAGYAIGYGKLLVARELMMQVRLMLEGTAGVARGTGDGITGSLGVALRLSPYTVDWLELELGVRESWLPGDAAFAARAVAPTDRRTRTLEACVAVTVLVGKRRRKCEVR
jgi:hypothetical protein